jgi:hypothetical protein
LWREEALESLNLLSSGSRLGQGRKYAPVPMKREEERGREERTRERSSWLGLDRVKFGNGQQIIR